MRTIPGQIPRRIPAQPPTPPPAPTLQELQDRLVRMETRMVRLMAHLGLDADGNPKK